EGDLAGRLDRPRRDLAHLDVDAGGHQLEGEDGQQHGAEEHRLQRRPAETEPGTTRLVGHLAAFFLARLGGLADQAPARAASRSRTTSLARRPSARLRSRSISGGITLRISAGPVAPTSSITRRASSTISSRLSWRGMYCARIAS